MSYLLHVEDDARKQHSIHRVVELYAPKCRYLHIPSSGEALLILERHPDAVHAMLSDWNLPEEYQGKPDEKNGRLVAMRASQLELPTLIISGDLKPAGFERDFPPYIQWAPFDWASVIRDFLKEHAS